jgi:hypothetical protein
MRTQAVSKLRDNCTSKNACGYGRYSSEDTGNSLNPNRMLRLIDPYPRVSQGYHRKKKNYSIFPRDVLAPYETHDCKSLARDPLIPLLRR